MVEVLLAAGAKKDATDEDGWTPMHRAAFKGQAAVVEVLLAAGISIGSRSIFGVFGKPELPIDLARKRSHIRIVSILSSPVTPERIAAVQAKLSALAHRLQVKKLKLEAKMAVSQPIHAGTTPQSSNS